MKTSIARIAPFAALALVLVLAAGCARKTPPATPPAPPQTTAQSDTTTPTPTPTPPAETPPTPVTVRTEDFQPAFFDLDSDALREDARAALDANAKILRDNPAVSVTVEGHCDERGTAEYNQALGERRANAARDYLVNAGIDGSRLQSVSYGKERPFNPGHDEAAWAQNRRAHIVVR